MRAVPAGASKAPSGRRRRQLQRHAGTATFGAGVVTIVNLFAGILLARAVGAEGRGDYAAITAPVVVVAWLSEMGCQQAVTYFVASGRRSVGELYGTWRLLCVPLALISILLGQFIVRYTLADRPGDVRSAAAAYATCAALIVGLSPVFGVLLGLRRIAGYVALRVAQAMFGLIGYVILVTLDSLTVGWAVLITGASWLAILSVGHLVVSRIEPPSIPSADIAREGLRYGLRAHGSTVASVVSVRLDLILLPAFVESAELGWYAVAVSVATVVSSLFGAVAVVVLPSVASDAPHRGYLVGHAALLTGAAACVVGGVTALVAPDLLQLVFGAEFREAAPALRLLLPGAVAIGLVGVYSGGLLANNRPELASIVQFPAAVLTIVGLVVLLPQGVGIEGAAILSSVSYLLTLVLAYATFRIIDRQSSTSPVVMSG